LKEAYIVSFHVNANANGFDWSGQTGNIGPCLAGRSQKGITPVWGHKSLLLTVTTFYIQIDVK